MRPVICREYKKIQLSLVPRTVPVVMKTLHRAEKLLKDETPEGDKSLGDTMGKRFGEDEGWTGSTIMFAPCRYHG